MVGVSLIRLKMHMFSNMLSLGIHAIIATLVAFITAIVIMIANSYATTAKPPIIDGTWIVHLTLLTLIFALVFMSGEYALTSLSRLNSYQPISWLHNHLTFGKHASTIAISGSVILACWLPYIIQLFPGIIWFDTGDELAQYYGVAALDDPAGVISEHHPPFDTLIFGSFTDLGHLLFANYWAGLGIYTILQCLVASFELAWCTVALRRMGMHPALCYIMLAFFALFPALPIFFTSIVKDSLHMLFFIPWLTMFAQCVVSRLEPLRRRSFLTVFTVLSILSALTTKPGLYITVCCLALLPLIHSSRKTRVTSLLVCVITLVIASVVFPILAYPALHVRKSDANQMFVVPVQLMARAASDHPDGISAQERSVIDSFNVVSYQDMSKRYMPYIADPVIHLSLKDPSLAGQYTQVWLKVGQRYPRSYINGFLSLQSGWFSLRKTPSLGPMTPAETAKTPSGVRNQIVPQIENFNSWAFLHTPQFNDPPDNRQATARIAGLWQTVTHTPVLRILTYTALWTWILPMFIAYCCLRHGRTLRETLVHAPLYISLLLLLLNAISVPLKPTASRYMVWALIAVPLSLGLLNIQFNKRNSQHQSNVEA